jgi:PII-like signaling protein
MAETIMLMLFLNESDRVHHRPVVDFTMREAMKLGLRGATAFRAIEGFGAHLHLHRDNLLSMSDDEGIVIVIADVKEKIDALISQLDRDGVKCSYATFPVALGQVGAR